MRSWRLLVILVSVVAVTACDDDDDDPIDIDLLTETEFVQRAAASDVFEIETGSLAENQAEAQEVADFGAMLVMDHTMSSQRLMDIARDENINVPMPTAATLPEDKRTILTRLQSKNGTAFDQDFAAVQVQAHREAIELYERAVDELDDDDLRTFAEQTLPTLRQHLERAEDLRDQVGG
ncbi:DUF4142 domain-containing protein [uncultured Pontibacter sp.]|uniref:DUF4142 domain-containing protein n=1 Tax=uncultured Pontibacter sp. TaxID=453356 RepID=UPI002630838B|nr:DUF4142 domain-containing protein [uncultured Pontibacter sp.]